MHRGGEGAPLSWPREKEGVGSGGACLAQQMGIIWGRQEGALGAMVGTGLHLPRTGGSGTGPLRLSMQSGPRLRGGAAGSLPASWTYTGVVARSVGATAQGWGPKPGPGVPGFQPPSATVAHMGMGGHMERAQAPPGAPCWSRCLYRERTTLRCALSHPTGLSRAFSGHHGHPPSQPGHMQGAGGRAMDVTLSTRPGPEGHPSCLRVRAAPRWPARPPPGPRGNHG